MSAAKMVADSTQSELLDSSDAKKKKKKLKKSGKKVTLPEDEDSDLDLKKDLKPISSFIKDRPKMIEEMFRSVRGTSLQRALPELLKSLEIEELKQFCLEQLEVMSKKRIRRILAGEESANISSSGTDDETSDEGTVEAHAPPTDGADAPKTEGHAADSTSVHQEQSSKMDFASQEGNTESFNPHIEDIVIKQEPPDFLPDADDEYSKGRDDDEDEDLDVDPDDEEEEAYTTGSEDGELVHREDLVQSDYSGIVVKQEAMSDTEMEDGDATRLGQGQLSAAAGGTGVTVKQEVEDVQEEQKNVEELESELMSTVEDGTGESVDLLLPSIMMDQMELLELEMRARAIKAMLVTHQEGDQEGKDDTS